MKKVILFLTSLLLSTYSVSQVNRYTKPAPSATYSPMTFEELTFAPKIKNAKSNENYKKLEKIAVELQTYVEVNSPDELFFSDVEPLAKEMIRISESDLSNKENEILKIEMQFKKAYRDYEKRDAQPNFSQSSGNLTIRIGTPVYSSPNLPRNYAGSKLIGYTNSSNYTILSQHNDDFYKIKLDENIGYVTATWVKMIEK